MNSDEVRRQWADRSGEFSPAYYAHYGPDETSEAILSALERHVGPDGRVLELGCSSGRHLAHLFDNGFENLAGIEVNGEARDVMVETYPDLAEAMTFHHDAIEDVVDDFEDCAFDAIFSVETLQHVHPDAEWVFDELVRVSADLVLTAEVEKPQGDAATGSDGDDGTDRDVNYVHDEVPLFYRDWNRVFEIRGLVEVHCESLERETLRAFRPASAGQAD